MACAARAARVAARRPEEEQASVQSGASSMGKGWGDDYATIAPPPPAPGPPPAPPARGPPGPPPAPHPCGFHAHGDYSAAYKVDSYYSLQSESPGQLEAFLSHLESTSFQTDQNFNRVSTVISELCMKEKIEVIGCRMKAYRFVQVACKQCGKHACASHAENYTTEAVRQEGRNLHPMTLIFSFMHSSEMTVDTRLKFWSV